MNDLRKNARVVTNLGGKGKIVGFVAHREILVLIDGTDVPMRYTRGELFREDKVKARMKVGRCDCCYHPTFNPEDTEVYVSTYRVGPGRGSVHEQQLCAGCGGLNKNVVLVGKSRKLTPETRAAMTAPSAPPPTSR